jgi:hypothetical protein
MASKEVGVGSKSLVPDQSIATAVREGFCLASFVKPIPERAKKDKSFVGLDVSMVLTEEHEEDGVLPDEIVEAWEALDKFHLKKADALKVDEQNVELRLVPNNNDGCLVIKGAKIERATVSRIQIKGTGKGRVVDQLRFRIKTDLDKETWRWCGLYFGRNVWIRVGQAQGNLLH